MIGTFHSQFHIMFYMWLPLPNKGIITCHQLTCFLRQLLVIRIVMPPTLQNSPLLPLGHGLHIYIYIIDAFNLGLPCPCSYHHMLFMLIFNVPCIFLKFIWPLTHSILQLGIHFCSSLLNVFFPYKVAKKATKRFAPTFFNTQ